MQTTPSQPERHAQRQAALEQMILSASGWRAIFGGEDHSLTRSIDTPFRDITAVAADVYITSIATTQNGVHGRATSIVVATDSRPTGPAIADTVMRVCLLRGIAVRWLGVCPTPETLAYVAQDPQIDGFFYITASHNPSGHNGFKMGYTDGAVMPGDKAWPLIEDFRTAVSDWRYVDDLVASISDTDPEQLANVESRRERYRSEAAVAYRGFALDCSAGRLGRDRFFSEMRRRLDQRPLGIVGELNGSARSTSIDRTLLPELGISTAIYNDTPGYFSHQILPEGSGLEESAKLLAIHGAQDSAFQIAYVPDNDGDRGNLVFMDNQTAVTLDAQTVFALVVMTELAWTRYLEREHGETYPPLAVVANGPTSCRIDEICATFGARLYRAEVGEANVVALAEELRAQGMHVVILGEGSNGGNITPPSTVRDPLSTLLAMSKLHAFSLFQSLAGTETQADTHAEASDSTDFVTVARSLPVYTTLTTDDPQAKMQIGSASHAELKRHYEHLLPDNVPAILERLAEEYNGEISWRIHNYEGSRDRQGAGTRSGEERGGLKVSFYHPDGEDGNDSKGVHQPLAFVWMRGSGTEPVYRILADCRGDNQLLLDDLVAWQRDLVSRAAEAAQADPLEEPE